jgi:hypothetical protein
MRMQLFTARYPESALEIDHIPAVATKVIIVVKSDFIAIP